MKRFLIIACCALLPSIALGQSRNMPSWVKDGYSRELYFSGVRVFSATGYNEDNARNKAAEQAVAARAGETGIRSEVSMSDGQIRVEGRDELTAMFRILDEHTQFYGEGQYRVSLLVQILKNEYDTSQYEKVSVTNEYPFSARAFIPGMAQLHKGSKGKGIAFIVGEVAAIGGIVAFEGLRASNESKINSTHNAADRQRYIDNASTMQNVRNGFIAGAAAIYVWNIIDGAVAKGRSHVVVGGAQLSFAPYTAPRSTGVMLSLNF